MTQLPKEEDAKLVDWNEGGDVPKDGEQYLIQHTHLTDANAVRFAAVRWKDDAYRVGSYTDKSKKQHVLVMRPERILRWISFDALVAANRRVAEAGQFKKRWQDQNDVLVVMQEQTVPLLKDRAEATEARVAVLEKALEPFEKAHRGMFDTGHCGGASPIDWSDKWIVHLTSKDGRTIQFSEFSLTVGDFRRAALSTGAG